MSTPPPAPSSASADPAAVPDPLNRVGDRGQTRPHGPVCHPIVPTPAGDPAVGVDSGPYHRKPVLMSSATITPSTTTAQPLLQLRGINKTFGAVRALTDIDLEVAAGEVVALVGDNGAGKSTLVKVLAGVHRPDSGTVTFDGVQVHATDPSAALALGIATVFQDLALCENLDVVQNLFLGRELGPARLDEVQMEAQAWNLLHQLSAKIPSLRTPIASLSGGQRQTVAIARSLLGDPKIVILDEPTAALGVAQTAEVLDLIERLKERGLGVIMISHNMEDVRAVADRVGVLRLGRNNGDFRVADVSASEIVAAITGADDNAVSRRSTRRAETFAPPPDGGPATSTGATSADERP
jgi:D-xylose transport system ATP-binding protein